MLRNLETKMDTAFGDALTRGYFSGAALIVADGGSVLYSREWGHCRQGGEPVGATTRFDLASLNKALVTAPLTMLAVDKGLLRLNDPLSRFFPAPPDKKEITIRHLLSHSSGLAPYRPFFSELVGVASEKRREAIVSMILDDTLQSVPGEVASYSDFGFILLGVILEEILGDRLDRLADKLLFMPLDMDELHFCPIKTGFSPETRPERETTHPYLEEYSEFERSASSPESGTSFSPVMAPRRKDLSPNPGAPPGMRTTPTCQAPLPANLSIHPSSCGKVGRRWNGAELYIQFAATEVCPWRKRLLVGEVSDENAWALGGVAGHAGLFGTARGVFAFVSHLRDIYTKECRKSFVSPEILQLFWTRAGLPEDSTWALGYDTPSPVGSSAGRYFSQKSVGHLGFTGTSFWFDLQRDRIVVLLSNRVHPTRENEAFKKFRPVVHDLVMEAVYGT